MDEELTLWELGRLEAERKLRTIGASVLETAWVRAAQIEAVIDAVLAIALGGDVPAYARAREVGEWSARIAAALENGPDPAVARRAGALRDLDPAALERIPELRVLVGIVREYQHYAGASGRSAGTTALIVAVADEFARRIAPGQAGHTPSASLELEAMRACSPSVLRPIVAALSIAVSPKSRVRVA